MSLEEIEGMRAEIKGIIIDIKKLKDAEELNPRKALDSVEKVKRKYDILVKEKGKAYCIKNCPDIPIGINKILDVLTEYQS